MQAAGWITAAKMAVCKVPTTDKEAMMSNLMGLFEKKRVANMFKFVQSVNPEDKSTWNAIDLEKQPMKDVYSKFGLEENTIDFLGHAIALHNNDFYLHDPAMDTLMK